MSEQNQNYKEEWKLRVMSHQDEQGEFFSIQDVLHIENIPDSSTTTYQFQSDTMEGLVELLEEAVNSVKEPIVKEDLLDGELFETEEDVVVSEDPLAPCKDEFNNLYEVIRSTPNNMELGKVIRQMYNGGIVKEQDTKQMELFED